MASSEQVHIAYKKVSPLPEKKNPGVAPIILLHGITSAKETWDQVMQPLADETGREVYALDARNHGDSGWNDDFSSDIIAEDVSRFLQKMSLSKVALIGHSFGGRAAMKLFPNLVEKLIIEDISPKRPAPTSRHSLLEYIQAMKKVIEAIPPNVQDVKEAKKLLRNLLGNTEQGALDDGAENTDGFYLGIKKGEDGKFVWKANMELLEKFAEGKLPSTPALAGSFKEPALFLCGKYSSFNVEKDEDIIKSMFPSSTLKRIEAGHQIHLAQPEKFVEEVVKFLNNSQKSS
ncbi:protein ABHD11-like [Uloborus diversus]|uniref:protein ABHD11-like n=1 Tax=Uloborus diversus TaxID=327109 RepID=UPI0024092E93|nr:protein ABHD11-like [Uloborus diversus]